MTNDFTNDIEDALVTWWQARNMLDSTGSRVMPGAESLEHARAQRAELSARDGLFRAMEHLLATLSSMRQDWPELDASNLLRVAGQFSEDPPDPPNHAHGKCG